MIVWPFFLRWIKCFQVRFLNNGYIRFVGKNHSQILNKNNKMPTYTNYSNEDEMFHRPF